MPNDAMIVNVIMFLFIVLLTLQSTVEVGEGGLMAHGKKITVRSIETVCARKLSDVLSLSVDVSTMLTKIGYNEKSSRNKIQLKFEPLVSFLDNVESLNTEQINKKIDESRRFSFEQKQTIKRAWRATEKFSQELEKIQGFYTSLNMFLKTKVFQYIFFGDLKQVLTVYGAMFDGYVNRVSICDLKAVEIVRKNFISKSVILQKKREVLHSNPFETNEVESFLIIGGPPINSLAGFVVDSISATISWADEKTQSIKIGEMEYKLTWCVEGANFSDGFVLVRTTIRRKKYFLFSGVGEVGTYVAVFVIFEDFGKYSDLQRYIIDMNDRDFLIVFKCNGTVRIDDYGDVDYHVDACTVVGCHIINNPSAETPPPSTPRET